MSVQNKRFIGILLAATGLLLIPLIARFPWSRSDFVIAGVLLFGTGVVIELILRNVTKTAYRIALCSAVLFLLFIVWAELAVGLIGTRFAGS